MGMTPQMQKAEGGRRKAEGRRAAEAVIAAGDRQPAIT